MHAVFLAFLTCSRKGETASHGGSWVPFWAGGCFHTWGPRTHLAAHSQPHPVGRGQSWEGAGGAGEAAGGHLGLHTRSVKSLECRVLRRAQEGPAVSLVMDLASWRYSIFAPSSDLGSRCGDTYTGAPRHVPLPPALLLGPWLPHARHLASLFRFAKAIPFWSSPGLSDICPLWSTGVCSPGGHRTRSKRRAVGTSPDQSRSADRTCR